MITNGAWIFLSHSSNDIEKVRKVRNAFEEYGHNPLAFHLRCMQTTTKKGKEELDELIKREIDARQWFVFCESPSAAVSPYVKMEREYILASEKRKVWSIDMSLDMDHILECVRKISLDLMICVDAVYPFNIDSIEMIEKKLIDCEYTIVDADYDGFEERGFIIFVICKNDLEGDRFHDLILGLACHAFEYGQKLIPVLVGEFDYSSIKDEFEIDEYNPIRIMPSGKGVEKIIERIENTQERLTSEEYLMTCFYNKYDFIREPNDIKENANDDDISLIQVIREHAKLANYPRLYIDAIINLNTEIRAMIEIS